MKFLKKCIIYLMLHGIIMGIGGIGFSLSKSGTRFDVYQETNDNLNLNAVSLGEPIIGAGFIYIDTLPEDLAIEYSFEVAYEPVSINLSYEYEDFQQNYSEDLFGFRESHYFTIRKDIFKVSVPILAKGALYMGGGINTHSAISPSINLLTTIMDDVNPNELIDAIETNSLDYTTSNIMDYADKINGTHIVMGMQGRLLWGNAFIKARYTLADIKNSTGFSDVSVGFAFGL